jgi:hypothetical protein
MEQSSGPSKHSGAIGDQSQVHQPAKVTQSTEEALAKFNKDHYDIMVTAFATPDQGSNESARPVVLLTAFRPVHVPSEIDVLVIKPADDEQTH